MVRIYFNRECSKCNTCLNLLSDKEKGIEVINYLENPPSKEEMKELLSMLGITPFELVRKSEPLFQQQFSSKNLSNDEWIDVLVNNPILIERPIVVKDGRAMIARPPEKVLEFYNQSI